MEVKMELLGNNFIIVNPYVKKKEEKEKSGIILPESTANEDLIKKEDLDRLEVIQCGPDCKFIKKGDFVKIINNRIPMSESIEKGKYLFLKEHDVIGIYK